MSETQQVNPTEQANPGISIPESAGKYTEKEAKFNFRKNVELGTKRPSVTLQLRVLTLQGLVSILESGDEKQINLVLETLQTPIIEQARNQVDENESLTADTLDITKLTWAFISNLEPVARRGGGIPKETWEAFVVDYIEVMPAVTGKTKEQATRAATLLGAKLASVKGNKPVLKFLRGALDLYFTNTAKAEEFQDCYEFLANKADTLISANDADLLKNL